MISYKIADSGDAEEIARLHATNWKRHYRGIMSDKYLDEEIDDERRLLWIDRFKAANPKQLVLKASQNGKLCGFACHFLDYDPIHGNYLDNLHVLSEYHKLGIGRKLMQLSIQHCLQFETRPYFLWVFSQNKEAIKFYDKLGGQQVKETTLAVPGQCAGHPSLLYQWDQPEIVLDTVNS